MKVSFNASQPTFNILFRSSSTLLGRSDNLMKQLECISVVHVYTTYTCRFAHPSAFVSDIGETWSVGRLPIVVICCEKNRAKFDFSIRVPKKVSSSLSLGGSSLAGQADMVMNLSVYLCGPTEQCFYLCPHFCMRWCQNCLKQQFDITHLVAYFQL